MGDRANVCIREDAQSPGVYFYVHWGGSELPDTIRQALGTPAARGRWKDAPYLTRILADAVSAANGGPGSETGMGISTSIQDDNQHAVLVLEVREQLVYFGELDCRDDGTHLCKAGPWSFTEYARRSEAPAWPRDEEEAIGF